MKTPPSSFFPSDAEARAASSWELPPEFSSQHEGSTPATSFSDAFLAKATARAPSTPARIFTPPPPHALHRDAAAPPGTSFTMLPEGATISIPPDVDRARVSTLSAELARNGVISVTDAYPMRLVLPQGWVLSKTDGVAGCEPVSQTNYFNDGPRTGTAVPFTKPVGDEKVQFGFYGASGPMEGHEFAMKGRLTHDGLVTHGGYPTEFNNAVRAVGFPAYMTNMKGRVAATAETMGHLYRDLALGAGRGVSLPGAGLTDFIAHVHAEVEGGAPDGTAIRRLGFAFGGEATMYYAMRARLYDLADRMERRDPRLPSHTGSPVYMTSAVSPLFPDFASARGQVAGVVGDYRPLDNTLLNIALFVLGETDADRLRNIADFESSGESGSLDRGLFTRLKDAQSAVRFSRLDRERRLDAGLTFASPTLAELADSASDWVGEWSDANVWTRRAEKIAAAAHEVSVLDVMGLVLMLWRPTPATFALGRTPAARLSGGASPLDTPLPRDTVIHMMQAEAAQEASAAAHSPVVAGRLLLRTVVLPACLRSLYGAEVAFNNHGQSVTLGARAHGLTLRADAGGRMDACLKGVRAQAALWAEVMHAAGLAPKWRV